MTTQKLRIAIDKDDTLNWLTHEIMVRSGVENPKPEDIPPFTEIKAAATLVIKAQSEGVEVTEDFLVDFPRVTLNFLKTRMECFKDPEFFAAKPYGLAHSIVDFAKESGFEPVICTKTLSDSKMFAEVTAAKMRFWKEHFSDIDMMIATGVKCIDAIALIDDHKGNCLDFNASNYRPTLVWNHITATEQLLNEFYAHCHTYASYLSMTAPTIHNQNVIVERSGDKARLSLLSTHNIEAEQTEYLREHVRGSSIVESVDIENNTVLVSNLYFKDVELEEGFEDIETLRNEKGSLNSIIFNNFAI
jgi:hypothetical protein